uniref:Uncharacterized protein n=1 Tax=viral metagenome TaxID=1070528 RepID=A0A6M3KMU3_9ZZZZ
MNARIPIGNVMGAQKISRLNEQFKVKLGTWWEFEHIRKGLSIDKWEQGNVCTAQGLNHMLDVVFHAVTAIATWYIGIFEDNVTPSDGTTYAVPVFTECSAYTEAARVAYVEAAAGSKSITNSASKATFTMNGTKTIYGAALFGGGTDPTVISNTAGGGTIFAASKFALSKSVVATDVLLVTCTITLADV